MRMSSSRLAVAPLASTIFSRIASLSNSRPTLASSAAVAVFLLSSASFTLRFASFIVGLHRAGPSFLSSLMLQPEQPQAAGITLPFFSPGANALFLMIIRQCPRPRQAFGPFLGHIPLFFSKSSRPRSRNEPAHALLRPRRTAFKKTQTIRM